MGKHRDKMAEDLVLRGMSANTSENYLRYARRFVAHHGRSADELGTEDARRWLLFLLQEKKLAPATVNVAIASLRSLFLSLGRPEMMRSIPYVRNLYRTPDILSGSEVPSRAVICSSSRNSTTPRSKRLLGMASTRWQRSAYAGSVSAT